MTGAAGCLEVGGGESEIGAGVQALYVVHLGTEGALAELTDRVEGEVEGANAAPGGRVVEGFVEMVGRREGTERVPVLAMDGLVEMAATSGDEGGTAGEGTGAERQFLSPSPQCAA